MWDSERRPATRHECYSGFFVKVISASDLCGGTMNRELMFDGCWCLRWWVRSRCDAQTARPGAASAGAGAGRAAGGRQRRARRLRADPAVAGPDARAGAGEDRGVRRRDGRRRCERRVVSVSSRRPHPRRRADRPHPDRRQGRQGLGAARRACRRTCSRAGRACSSVQPDRAFATNRTIYFTYTVLPDGADPATLPRSPATCIVAQREALGRRQAPRRRQGSC